MPPPVAVLTTCPCPCVMDTKLSLDCAVTMVELVASLSNATALTTMTSFVTEVIVGQVKLATLVACTPLVGVTSNGVVVSTPLNAAVNPFVTVPLVTPTVWAASDDDAAIFQYTVSRTPKAVFAVPVDTGEGDSNAHPFPGAVVTALLAVWTNINKRSPVAWVVGMVKDTDVVPAHHAPFDRNAIATQIPPLMIRKQTPP